MVIPLSSLIISYHLSLTVNNRVIKASLLIPTLLQCFAVWLPGTEHHSNDKDGAELRPPCAWPESPA